jgi:hypothetical protein
MISMGTIEKLREQNHTHGLYCMSCDRWGKAKFPFLTGSAAPGEKGWCAVGVVQVHAPCTPMAEATFHKSFCPLCVPSILSRLYRFVHHHFILLFSD